MDQTLQYMFAAWMQCWTSSRYLKRKLMCFERIYRWLYGCSTNGITPHKSQMLLYYRYAIHFTMLFNIICCTSCKHQSGEFYNLQLWMHVTYIRMYVPYRNKLDVPILRRKRNRLQIRVMYSFLLYMWNGRPYFMYIMYFKYWTTIIDGPQLDILENLSSDPF